MSTQRQRSGRHDYAGYGWAWVAFLSGMMALGLLFTLGSGGLGSLVWFIAFATCACYSFKAYEKAQRRRNHPSA